MQATLRNQLCLCQADKLVLLVDHLNSQLAGIPIGMPQLLLKHDAMLILLMWDTPIRVNDCVCLSW